MAFILGRCQTFLGIEIHRRCNGASGSLTKTFDCHFPGSPVCRSPLPWNEVMPLMTVWMPFSACVRARAQNKYPPRPNLRREYRCEKVQGKRLPSHQRIFSARHCSRTRVTTELICSRTLSDRRPRERLKPQTFPFRHFVYS